MVTEQVTGWFYNNMLWFTLQFSCDVTLYNAFYRFSTRKLHRATLAVSVTFQAAILKTGLWSILFVWLRCDTVTRRSNNSVPSCCNVISLLSRELKTAIQCLGIKPKAINN